MSTNKNPHEDVRFEVITQEDENGDLILPIPQQLLDKLGWKEGDDIQFGLDEAGRIFMKKR
jgi:bifunctional DNA-binding transcriptional regulator/antitoxin component of YhaV-PrlF toxin-antitoxin module